jgi:cobaltochelatase CobS
MPTIEFWKDTEILALLKGHTMPATPAPAASAASTTADLENILKDYIGNLKASKKVSGASEEAEEITKELKWTLEPKEGEKLFSDVFGFKPPSPMEDFSVPVYKPKDWNEEIRPFIPKVDTGFVLDPHNTALMVLAYLTGDNTFLWGPKGSGKSSYPEQICARLCVPFLRIGMKEDMESSELLGSNTVRAKEVIWIDGPVTVAATYGGVLCLDESSNITPGAAIALHPLLEENRRLFLTDKIGSVEERNIKIDPRFRVFLTDNTNLQGDITGKYVGTKVQNEAFIDRIFTKIMVGYMEPKKEVAMLASRVPELPTKVAEHLVKFADLVRKSYTQGTMQMTVSPRVLINWARKAVAWGSLSLAYDVAFGNGLSDDDKRLASEHYQKVFGK